MPALLVRYPPGKARRFELSSSPLTVGRSEACDIHLPSEEISREHAHIWIDEHNRVLVQDRRSKNGTRVDTGEPFRNEVRVARRSIRVGEFELEIVEAPPADDTADTRVVFQPDPPSASGDASFFPPTRQLDLNTQRLALLMSLAERISGVFDRKQLLEQALDACCEALSFERGLIVIKTQRGDTEAPVTRNVQRDATGAYTVSRTLINRALLHGERAVVNNLATDMVGNISDSLVRFPICSALCVPILHREEILGAIYGDRITQASTYTNADVDFLAAIARQVGVGLSSLRLLNRHVDLQRMVEEIKQARTIQRRLLPAEPLRVGRVALAGYNEPSSDVGGDYFDYFTLEDGRVGLTIADVTGHGLPAALLMANFQAAVHVGLTAGASLAELAARLNRLVYRNTSPSVFITAIVGRLDPETGLVEYVNAGHPAPVVLHKKGAQLDLEGRALPFGIDQDESYETQTLTPVDGLSAALFYTDGLVEAADPQGQQLGYEAIADALARIADPSADAVMRAALDIVSAHLGEARNLDDLTLLALRWGD